MPSGRKVNHAGGPGSPAPAAGRSDPFIGKTIGNCEIVEKINEGGTAYIYRGHNIRFDLDRVVKILKPSLTEEEDFFYRFRQEAQLTARLDHPNILRVFDTGEVQGYFYIEMEQISGRTLREYIQETPRINERDVLAIGLQVVNALSYAHHAEISAPDNETIQGILHRDIKPENIMLTPGKLVKLMDFGAAKPLNITSNTMQGMVVGTFHYMSPEQLKGGRLDMRSDFFSLGIVLYELCTGQKPFSAENLTELIEKITACKYHRIRQLRPSITPMTEEVIEKLLSRDPEHRPSSASEIQESLQICTQVLNSWGTGRKVRVPFSAKRLFPSIALAFSSIALILSLAAFFGRGPARGKVQYATPARLSPISGASLLSKGKQLEEKGMWREAVEVLETVPSVEQGGLANEYLEAQIRVARISFKHRDQLTKARSILEQLRMEYSDPAIDAYLGQIYFRQALYIEAKERFEAALNSKKGSVIAQDQNFRSSLLYYHANALDRQYIYVERDESLLVEAIKAWNYFRDFTNCDSVDTEQCSFAERRLGELQSINRKLNEN